MVDEVSFEFIIDTDSYAGNCEREMCAFVTGIWDNEPYTSKQHHECRKAWMDYNEDAHNDEWFPLDYSDDFEEHRDKIRQIYGI